MQEPDFNREMIWHAVLDGTLDESYLTESDYLGLQLQIMDAIIVKKQSHGCIAVDTESSYDLRYFH